jgi:MSHA pilin protein MshC
MVPRKPGGRSGFTLIELVMTLVVVGILAVSIIPRFLERDTFESLGFHDETLAVLRYAQKAAVAQRHTVCLSFTASSVALTLASASPPATACDTNLTGPDGSAPYQIVAPSGVSYAAVPTDFYFTALGQASTGQTLQVAGAARSITVESETGYVHE